MDKQNEEIIIPEYDKEKEVAEVLDKTSLSGYETPERIKALKEQYSLKEVVEVVIGNKIAYFKKASRATLRAALSFLEKDRMKYMEVVLENCFLAGDRSLLSNDDDFYSLIEVVPDLTSGKEAKIKKY